MTDAEISQIRNVLDLEAWKIIQEMLRWEMEDMTDGRYEDIAINVLAKVKAKEHVEKIINKINSFKEVAMPPRQSFK